MQVQDIHHMFQFTFEKPSDQIVNAAEKKKVALLAKIVEREARIRRIREEYKVTNEVLLDVMQQARKAQRSGAGTVLNYTTSAKTGGDMHEEPVTIGAGVVNNLLTESDFIDGERAQIDKLDIIVRNLADLVDGQGRLRGHQLSFEELRYLGF